MIPHGPHRLAALSLALSLAMICAVAGALAQQKADPAVKEADTFLTKVQQIRVNETAKRTKGPARTTITESELNAWLKTYAKEYLPTGVIEPTLALQGQSRLSCRAVVDTDSVKRERKSGGWLDPWQFVSGRLPVTASGILHTKDGIARLELESVTISGIPVPQSLLQEMVSHYSRTPEDPDGVRLDDPFPLAAGIKEIIVDPQQAVVVQ